MNLNLIKNDVDGFTALFKAIYKDDPGGCQLAMSLLHVIHTWDDLIDKDHPVSDEAINCAFLFALTDIAGSPLWGPDLAAAFRSVYFRWVAANDIEHDKDSTDDDLAKAWMLRAGFYDLFVMIAEKLHGRVWAENVSATVHKLYGETLVGFIKEIRDGQYK